MQLSKLMIYPGYCQAMFPFLKAYWIVEVLSGGAFPDKEAIKVKMAAFCKATFAGIQEDQAALPFVEEVLADLEVELAKEGAISAAELSQKTPQQARFIVDELLKEKYGA